MRVWARRLAWARSGMRKRLARAGLGGIPVAPLLALSLFSCAAGPRLASESTQIARNLEIEVNGVKCVGTCVFKQAPRYEIKIRSKADMDFLLIRTCHRSEAKEREGTDYKWTYEPTRQEQDRACPIRLTGLEEGKGRISTGFIDFTDARKTLEVALQCNGKALLGVRGVAACEAAAGLLQAIEFNAPVRYSTQSSLGPAQSKHCDTFKTQDGKRFEYVMPQGECTITFEEDAAPYRQLRLNTYGFVRYQAGEF